MNNKSIKKVLASILVISMVFGLVGVTVKIQTVMAEVGEAVGTQTKTVNLQIDGNISGITNPNAPVDTEAWSGSKVYFGKYNNNPLLFRVLDANTTDYSKDGTTKTMLLDSENILVEMPFNSDKTDNLWANSDVKVWMQGQFFNQFSIAEQGAIIASNKTGNAPLVNDTVFALDTSELRNPSYGYSSTDGAVTNRIKRHNGASKQWWTRSSVVSNGTNYVSIVQGKQGETVDGKIGNAPVSYGWALGVSPAMNLNLSSILFATESGQNKGSFATTEDSVSNTWNLTLAGGKGFTATLNNSANAKNISVNITNLGTTLDGSELSEGYYSQVSAMLVDKNGTVLAYGKISDVATGNVSFAVPEGIEKGTYTLKVFAEKVNSSASNNATDYASNMASFEINYLMAETKNINLQINGEISGITDPNAPVDTEAWSGSKVYFGKYGNNPVLFRVLDANTTDYSADGTTETMLLDSDALFELKYFNAGERNNSWTASDIKAWMQGAGDGQFLRQFSETEKGAIIASNKNAPSTTDGQITAGGASFAPLVNDTVFALDATELKNTSYGYSGTDAAVTNRLKILDGNINWWWTRSPFIFQNENYVQFAHKTGQIANAGVPNLNTMGLSPAMNLNLSAILYASAVGTTQTVELGEVGSDLVANNEWKLTLLDNSKTVGIQENKYASKDGSTVTVPYTFNGNGINQVSIMITSTERTNAAAQVLYYGKLATVSGTQGSDSATFTLPEGLPEGYKVYLIAEGITSGNGTNYASNPVELDITVQTDLGTVYQSLDSGDYTIDFDGGMIVDGVKYEKGDTIKVTGEYEIMYTESSVLYKGTLVLYRLGDLNTDNDVDITDLVTMDEHLNNDKELSLSGNKAADIVVDDTIDEKDFSQLVQNLLNK